MNDEDSAREQLLAVEAAEIGLWSWRLSDDHVEWNQRMHEITGSQEPLTLARWIDELVHPDDREAVRARSANTPDSPGRFAPMTSRILRPDGEIRWVLASGRAVTDATGAPVRVVGVAMDVTEQQRMEAQLRAAQRMEALGHLTAGVAHNFNNMLMVIAPTLERLRDAVSGAERADAALGLAAAQRAAEIVSQLMTLAGEQPDVPWSARPIAAICQQVVQLCRSTFPAAIALTSDVRTASLVECAAGGLEQVLTNLLLNARDAIVADRTSDVPAVVQLRACDLERFGERWVEITVADSGPGISDTVQNTLFEPFVTTKPSGTGLGLATCQAIVQRHGGQLAWRPASPRGTEFLVLLPVAPPPDAAPAMATETPAADAVSARVLLIDDEPAIRSILERGLSRLGHDVASADSPASVRELLERDTDFGFVLLDRSLGGSSGGSLIQTLRAKLPGALVYYFTGQPVRPAEAAAVDGVIDEARVGGSAQRPHLGCVRRA